MTTELRDQGKADKEPVIAKQGEYPDAVAPTRAQYDEV